MAGREVHVRPSTSASSACSNSRPITAATRSTSSARGSRLSSRARITACTVSGSDKAPASALDHRLAVPRRDGALLEQRRAHLLRGRTDCRRCVRTRGAPARRTPASTCSDRPHDRGRRREIERLELNARCPCAGHSSRAPRSGRVVTTNSSVCVATTSAIRRSAAREAGVRPVPVFEQHDERRAAGQDARTAPRARRARPPADARHAGGAEARGTRSAPTADGDRAAGTARAMRRSRESARRSSRESLTPRHARPSAARRISTNGQYGTTSPYARQRPCSTRTPLAAERAPAARTAAGSCRRPLRRRPRRRGPRRRARARRSVSSSASSDCRPTYGVSPVRSTPRAASQGRSRRSRETGSPARPRARAPPAAHAAVCTNGATRRWHSGLSTTSSGAASAASLDATCAGAPTMS